MYRVRMVIANTKNEIIKLDRVNDAVATMW
jgi:hypothetical protein